MDYRKYIMNDTFNKKVADNFWSNRALMEESRWTGSDLLEFEKIFLKNILPSEPITILDLGCGSGQLSKAVKRPNDILIAVDNQRNYQRFFDGENTEFVECDVTEYEYSMQIDLILLFGVINYLTSEEIAKLFNKISNTSYSKFQLIIKAQFAIEKDYEFDKFSDDLNFQYSARYPRFENFLDTFSGFKKSIEIIDYPSEFNQRDNFVHKAIRIYEN